MLAGAPVVRAKGLLRILLDPGLTFQPLLHNTLARGRSLFDDFLQAAECGGFSIPVAAAQVPPRIESVILYASPLLATAEERPKQRSNAHTRSGAAIFLVLGGSTPVRQSQC